MRRADLRRAGVSLLALIAVLAGGLIACAPATPPRPVTLVVTATNAELRPTLPDALRADLATTARKAKKAGQAMVRVISDAAESVAEHDITPLRANGDVDHGSGAGKRVDEAVAGIERLVADTKAAAAGLDLLPLLDRAGQMPDADIHIISSGLSTTDPVDWRAMGWTFDIDNFVDSLKKRGLLPDLSGHTVTLHGLGVVAGSQPRLPPFARQLVERFWLRVCHSAGAHRCSLAEGSPAADPPTASLPVPVVPVPDAETEGGCPRWLSLTEDTLHFAGNSAALPGDADAVLGKVAADVRTCNLTVEIAGHVADTGPGDDKDLSQRRAQAVADRLLALELPSSALRTVVGKGESEPVIANWTNGRFDEARAKQNRRVELTFFRAGR